MTDHQSSPPWPEAHASSLSCLEAHALPDDRLALAYESLSGQERALLKKNIARHHALWGELPCADSRARRYRQGFSLTVEERPAPYLLLACQASYPYPAAFLAALMPAILAGVREIIPCFVADGKPEPGSPSHALLAALELAGVERAYAVADHQVTAIAEALADRNPGGRILLLGRPPFCRPLALFALERGISCLALSRVPVYFHRDRQRLAEQTFTTGPDDCAPAAASASAPESSAPGGQADAGAADLHLDESNHDVWIWSEMGPEWFRTRRVCLSATAGVFPQP